MERKKRLFLISAIGLFLILIFLSINSKIQDFFFFELTKNQNLENRLLEQYYATFKPFRDWKTEELELKAQSALSLEIEKQGLSRALFNKNSETVLPIASLTKLMTALVALDSYDLQQEIDISSKVALIEGGMGYFRVGERFGIKDLLYPLLMESSNQAAQALAEITGEKKFVELMNAKAQELGLQNTRFFNPTGLDPDWPDAPANYSTAKDIATLSRHLLEESLIWEILRTGEYELYTAEGIPHHQIKNTNELLQLPDEVDWKPRILGGKTGWTPRAGECLVLILEHPQNKSFIINVILDTQDRFEEMKKLVDWIYSAYRW